MSNAPPRPCARCRRLIRGGGRCPTCRPADERRRPSARARGYDEQWAQYSRAWLRRFPWCGMRKDGLFHVQHSACTRRGEHVAATVTDHIVAIADGGARLDPNNHQSLCDSCNVTKSAPRGPRL